MGRVLAVMNQKGGVGKTTTTVNLGMALAQKSLRVLLVDLDPSGGMSHWLAESDAQTASGLDSLLGGNTAPHDTIQSSKTLGVDFIPAGKNLRNVAGSEETKRNGLKDSLSFLRDDYDFILIDCPPSLETLSESALLAADSILIPIQTETLPLQSGIRFFDWLGEFKQEFNCPVDILGILPCQFDSRTRLSRQILDSMRSSESLGPLVFETIIRKNVRLAELPGSGKSIFKSASSSFGANDYSQLAAEVMRRCGISAPETGASREAIDSPGLSGDFAAENGQMEPVQQGSGSYDETAGSV